MPEVFLPTRAHLENRDSIKNSVREGKGMACRGSAIAPNALYYEEYKVLMDEARCGGVSFYHTRSNGESLNIAADLS